MIMAINETSGSGSSLGTNITMRTLMKHAVKTYTNIARNAIHILETSGGSFLGTNQPLRKLNKHNVKMHTNIAWNAIHILAMPNGRFLRHRPTTKRLILNY
jgi:hypothetical protein